jgi:hypothetical protein
MIRWIFLLQGFDLQIIQRSEEQHEDQESLDEEIPQHKVGMVCVPPGTIRSYEGFPPFFVMVLANIWYPQYMKGKGERHESPKGKIS